MRNVIVRIALAVLALVSVELGVWATFAPRSFFDDYPGLGHWFAEIGSPAYDEAGTALARQRAFTFLGLEVGA